MRSHFRCVGAAYSHDRPAGGTTMDLFILFQEGPARVWGLLQLLWCFCLYISGTNSDVAENN